MLARSAVDCVRNRAQLTAKCFAGYLVPGQAGRRCQAMGMGNVDLGKRGRRAETRRLRCTGMPERDSRNEAPKGGGGEPQRVVFWYSGIPEGHTDPAQLPASLLVNEWLSKKGGNGCGPREHETLDTGTLPLPLPLAALHVNNTQMDGQGSAVRERVRTCGKRYPVALNVEGFTAKRRTGESTTTFITIPNSTGIGIQDEEGNGGVKDRPLIPRGRGATFQRSKGAPKKMELTAAKDDWRLCFLWGNN